MFKERKNLYFLICCQDILVTFEFAMDFKVDTRFEQTSSTKLELQTLLWALGETITLANGDDMTLTVYTDSQNIIGLPRRRARLEQNNSYSR